MIGKLQLLLLFLFLYNSAVSQVTGKVTDTAGQPLPYVNIYTGDGKAGTTTNEDGDYSLKLNTSGSHTLIFQYLGYETLRFTINIEKFPFEQNARLKPTTTSLDAVTINSNENPANKIIRLAIDNRKLNLAKIQKYTADYYSRGLWRIKNAPERILGQDIGDLGGGLDSTRSGIVYLSETISEITYRAPDDFKEKIIASKVSGNDNGFSLNSARESEFSFYENTVDINSKIVSPIADYAFNYYTYKLEGVFYDDSGQLINKISVTPKRPQDRVFYGSIYIVEDSWQLYGLELNVTGKAIQFEAIEILTFTQNFKYSEENKFWIKISQTVDFSFAMFGISGDGRFTAVYSNHNFEPQIDNSTFSREVMAFAQAANKKDSLYWQTVRPVPLTSEELSDYIKKDSIQVVRNSRTYLDSVDGVRNKFSVSNLLFGYNYSNSYRKNNFNISSPLLGTNFNTVQGWNTSLNLSFRQNLDDSFGKYWRISGAMNYGFAEEQLRYTALFQKKFNNFSRPILSLSGGVETAQINNRFPISERVNTITSLFFERNYLKLYERQFVEAAFQQELFNGFTMFSNFSYQQRNPLFNTSTQLWKDRAGIEYSSNDPLQPDNFESRPFESHNIFKLNLNARINFAQNYMSYPDGKYNMTNNKYPTLFLGYEKGFGASVEGYDFDKFTTTLRQDISLANKGTLSYNLKGGTFLKGENIAYLDYQHFNGNQTRVGTGNYIDKFNLLPYYALSTNDRYAEMHFEHDFKGWILGKIPGLNLLNYNLVIGAHFLSTVNNTPYSEYSVGIDNLGFGKYRLLRLDYVVSEFEGNRDGAFIFGLKFLNLLD
ncbi:MAG: DUF5686 and carboxypeptidase regulatory-like domain-containing protein [Gillisia sp.]